MNMRSTVFVCAMLLVVAAAAQDRSSTLTAVGAELVQYVQRAEPDFAWSLVDKTKFKSSSVSQLKLISQKWQGIVWQHDLVIFEPAELIHPEHLLLFITGGSNDKPPRQEEMAMGASMAALSGARVAVLHQVPNQPLLGDRYEDDLITETWLRYLDTGDTSWPLLFPMVKSVVKAMDALEAFGASENWKPIKGFVTAGASKRGWTSWLTPAADKRVIATAPMVIDMLKFSSQIRHQYEMWGQPSEQIHDYTSKNLISKDGVPRSDREAKLWEMMDPYVYRDRVLIPKLLIVGANDPYWATDAMNQYWDDLAGQKSIYRGANAGHGLEGKREAALSTLGVFFRHAVSGKPMPELVWKPLNNGDSIGLEVSCEQDPNAVRFWVAKSDSMDFRQSLWRETLLPKTNGQWTFSQPIEPGEHVAVFAEFVFEYEGLPFMLSTLAYCR